MSKGRVIQLIDIMKKQMDCKKDRCIPPESLSGIHSSFPLTANHESDEAERQRRCQASLITSIVPT